MSQVVLSGGITVSTVLLNGANQYVDSGASASATQISSGGAQYVSCGVTTGTVISGGYQEIEVDFVANNPGLTLFHCHQQLHMDFGFMTLFEYI